MQENLRQRNMGDPNHSVETPRFAGAGIGSETADSARGSDPRTCGGAILRLLPDGRNVFPRVRVRGQSVPGGIQG